MIGHSTGLAVGFSAPTEGVLQRGREDCAVDGITSQDAKKKGAKIEQNRRAYPLLGS